MDESGNSGPKLDDNVQPIYTLAGFTCPGPDAEALAGQLLAKAAAEFKVDLGKNAKGRNKLDPERERGWLFVERLMGLLGEARCVPFLVLAEKRYVIAGKIVETFLDPVDNDAAPREFEEDVEARQEAASWLTCLPEAVLFRFSDAFRNRDSSELAAALEDIIAAVSRRSSGLATAFIAMRGRESELVDELRSLDVDGPGNKSLNLPCFVAMITMLELFGRGVGAENVRIVHDASQEFEVALTTAYKALRDAAPGMLPLSNGNVMATGYKSLRGLEFGSSKLSRGIQIADLIAGAARTSTTCILNKQPLCDAGQRLGGQLLSFALIPQPKVATLIISSAFAKDVVGPLLRHGRRSQRARGA